MKRRTKGAKTMAVVKADAYGNGMVEVARHIYQDVDYFGVAFANEGVSLREYVRLTPILLFVYRKEDIRQAIKHQLTMSISSVEELNIANTIASNMRQVLSVHIAVNSGMNRYGFGNIEELKCALNSSLNMPYISIKGIYTHLYDGDRDHNIGQLKVFDRYRYVLEHVLGRHVLTHALASHGIANFGGCYDMVRLGISMYIGDDDGLRDSFRLISHIQSIHKVNSGEFVGYSCKYRCICDTIIGVVYGGYADGMMRAMSGHDVFVRGRRARVIGEVCMDVFFIDLTGIMDVKVGDEVTIIGGKNSIEKISHDISMSPYDILTCHKGRTIRSYECVRV